MPNKLNLEQFIQTRIVTRNISCKSFVVTVFGDVISQHGGWVWLGSLINSLQPLGFSERLIRTSVYRLVQEDWLQGKKVGRKSFYAFTDSASKHYAKAERRIYSGNRRYSDDRWLIVLPCFVAEAKLNVFKRQLQWLGFSALTTGAYAHPSIDQTSLVETVSELNLNDSVIIFSSKTLDNWSDKVLRKLVFEKWTVEKLQSDYQSIINDYQARLLSLVKSKQLADQNSYLLRLLLIHEYRRVLLKDHELPENMLPENWIGYSVNQLVKDSYANLAKPSNRYITGQLESFDGLLSQADQTFTTRFK